MRRAMAARSLLAAVLLLYIDQATNAPVTDDATSQALQLAESVTGLSTSEVRSAEERRVLDFKQLLQSFLHTVADSMSPKPGTYAFPDGRGCYYNFERYDEGDRILTNEPCLNCTCHNKMLMCYLRVCPFTKAIGQDCTVEKKPDQCCPVITCPQVHVALLTSSTTSESPTTSTALGRPDSYGCILEDNAFYPDGAQVPSDLKKPCELCYCIRNQTACVMQQCTLNVEGCKPVYQEGVCCPVRYDCDYDEVLTTPKPVGLVTTPGGSSDCIHDGVTYYDGAMVRKDEKAPCEHCYCMRGDIVCAVPQCGTPLEGRDCTPLPPTHGQCCPNYQCANGTQEPVLTSTEKLPEASVQVENQGSGETSNESDNSSEESQEVSTEPPKTNDNTDEVESHYQQPQSTETPELTSSSQNPQTQQTTELPQPSESESIKTEEQVSPVEDSHSEASQHSESEAQAPNDVKDVQGTNEIPSLTPEQPAAETTTEGPVIEAARIPGEGSCLVEGKTYAHNTIVPTENPCQEICRCFSSIVRCNPRDCPPAPSPDENCMPVTTPGSCCPTYMCDQKTSDAPEVQDHKIDNIHEEGNSYIQDIIHSTLPPAFEEPPATEAPAIFGTPPDSPIPGTNEQVETTGPVDEVSNVPHSESDTEKKEETFPHHTPDTQHSINDNSHLDSNLVHSHDASLHGGQVENSDSHENGNIHHPIKDISTTAPFHDETTLKSEGEEESITHRPEDSISQTDKIISNEEQDLLKPQTDSPVDHHEEEVYEPESQNGTTEPSESEIHNKYTTTEENINENNGISHVTYKPEDQNSAEQNLENTFEPVTHKETNMPPEETYNKETVTTDLPAKEDSPSENVEQQNSVSEENKESNQSHLDTTSDEQTTSHQDESHVTESHLTESHVTESHLTESHVTESHVTESHVTESHVTESHLTESHLTEAHESQHFAEIPSETTILPSSIEENISDSDEHHEPPHKEEHNLTEIHEEPTQTEVSEAHIPTENSELHSSSETQSLDDDKTVSVTTLPTVDTHASSGDEVTEQVLVNSFDQTPEVNKETQEISNPPGFPSVYQPEETQPLPTTEKPSEDEKSEGTTVPAPSKTEENDSIPESSENIEEVPTHDKEKIENEENNKHSPSDSQELSNNEATSPTVITTSENTEPAVSSEDGQVEAEQTGPLESNNKEEEKQSVIDKEFENPGIASSDSIPNEEESPAPVEHNGSSDSSLDTAKDDLPTIIYEEVTVTGMPSIESHVTEGTLDHSVSHQESSHSVQTTTQSHQESEKIHTPGPVGIEITSSTGNQGSTHIKEENINQNEEKPSQENSESEIHPTISPDIINEINEEKESLNKISSDNTAQLIEDINQIIQNEVNNQLYSNGQQTHQSEEDPHKPSVENEPETDKNSQNEQGTTATPFVEKPYSEGESILTAEEHGENVINEETVVTESIPEEEPVQTSEEHQELGEDITATQLVTTPPTTDPPSITSSQVDVSNQKPIYENEHHSEQTDDTSPIQSSTELYNMDNGNEASQQHESDHTTTEPNENSDNILEESVDQIKDGINGISTEAVLQESSEKEIVQGSVTESHEEISSSIPQSQSVENENHNVISGEVTHIVNSDSEVPDSANQVLVASGDGEDVPSTEQSAHMPEGGELDIPEEENLGSITEEIHQEGNIVHNEENTISEENHRPITESGPEEVSSQEGVSEEGVPPIHESGQVSQEDGTMTHETPTVHQGGTVPDHPTETNYVAVTELSPVQTESNPSNPDGSQHIEDSEKQETVSEHQEIIPDDNKQILGNQEPISENQPTTTEHHGDSATQSLEHHEGVPVTQSPEHHEGVPVTQSPEHHEGVPVTQSPEQHEDVPVTQSPEQHEDVPVTQSPEYHEGEPVTQSSEQHEVEPVTQSSEHHVGEPVTQSSEHHEVEPVTQSSEHHEGVPVTLSSEHHEGEAVTLPSEHHEVEQVTQSSEQHEVEPVTQSSEHHEGEPVTQSSEHHEGEPVTQTTEEHESDLASQTHDHHIFDPAIQTSEHHDNQLANLTPEHDSELSTETLGHHDSEAAATTPEHHYSEAAATTPDHHESETAATTPDHHESESATKPPEHHENQQAIQTPEHHENEQAAQIPEHHESEPSTQTTEHHGSESASQDTSSQIFENNENDKEASTGIPITESSSESIHLEEHVSTEGVETQKHESPGEHDVAGEGDDVPTPETNISENVPTSSTESEQKPVEAQQPDFSQNIVHSTETASISEILSSTQKPIEEPSPMFPTWSQKPLEQHTTPEPHPPEENAYPSGFDPEYEDEEGASYAPGTCRYGGKVYLSAQQIPRDDPCDFCFCFRSDIICLQQSCPPPIRGCYQETIKGFCCPRYECHVSMATMLNVTTTTTTTTTTLPPLFFSHAYSGSAMKAGCQVKGVAYNVGERIPSTSGPCLECRCGANGQMKCDPTVCGPQEALLRQVMDAAVSRRRR